LYEGNDHGERWLAHLAKVRTDACGRRPAPGTEFSALYRIGSGGQCRREQHRPRRAAAGERAGQGDHRDHQPDGGGRRHRDRGGGADRRAGGVRVQERAVTPDNYGAVSLRNPAVAQARDNPLDRKLARRVRHNRPAGRHAGRCGVRDGDARLSRTLPGDRPRPRGERADPGAAAHRHRRVHEQAVVPRRHRVPVTARLGAGARRVMAAMGKMAWFALMNWKTRMGSLVRFIDIISPDRAVCGFNGQRVALPTTPQAQQPHQ